ncbi:MAG: hypothetical protein NZ606_00580 [Candidatus Kapabacteria bacterium]|nr:hypothetical protein [Candidatus Kapabacteria bacterium]MCX7936627.1 hypothetical protein [Chlorobiota bacterium]
MKPREAPMVVHTNLLGEEQAIPLVAVAVAAQADRHALLMEHAAEQAESPITVTAPVVAMPPKEMQPALVQIIMAKYMGM